MNPFSAIARHYRNWTFRRNNWRIVQDISAQRFTEILQAYIGDGWEITDNYQGFDPEMAKWQCQLRKGTSCLRCHWRAGAGSIYGPARIINGLGQEFGLSVLTSPH